MRRKMTTDTMLATIVANEARMAAYIGRKLNINPNGPLGRRIIARQYGLPENGMPTIVLPHEVEKSIRLSLEQ